MNDKQTPQWEEEGMESPPIPAGAENMPELTAEDAIPVETEQEPAQSPEEEAPEAAEATPSDPASEEEAAPEEAPTDTDAPQEEPATEEESADRDTPQEEPEPSEESAAPEAATETAEEPTQEESSQPEITGDPTFMDRIPDVDEDYPEETAPAEPEQPRDLTKELSEELDFDLSILDVPQEEPQEETEAGLQDQEYRDNGREFDEMFHAGAPERSIPSHLRPARKGRPKRKKGEGLLGIPNMLTTVVWLALIVFIGVTLGRMLWVCAADVLAFGREDKVVTITIYEADTMEQITDKLHKAGLIRYKSLFNLYASISDAEEDIQPGIYDLNTRYDYHALVNFMSPRSSREVIELTIPEGYTCRQIFALLEDNRVCTVQDLESYTASGDLDDYWFLEGVERGTPYCLEGFLFPDTYQFYKNSSPREALEKMLDNFDYRFTDEMRGQIETLNANVTGGGYTVREIVIVASLIEKETAGKSESPMIASVIYNRLFNWDYPAFLNIDAAIIYAQGGNADFIDTSIDSPYNTYLYTGLTPTPIANPGLASLMAALNPETSDYYFYVLNPSTGKHQFSKTQDEHNAWVAKFYHD